MAAAPMAAKAEAAQGFDEAYRRLIDSGRYQTEMSRAELSPPPEAPGWLQRLLEWLAGTGGFWEALLWCLAALAAGALLFFAGRALYRTYAERRRDDGSAEPEWRPEEGAARALLDEAEALARAGRYAEAAHLLLQRSLEDIDARLPDFLQPALTSRDIAAAERLPEAARSAFSTIAAVVERGIFARRPVDEAGWSEARAAYGRFAFGDGG